MNASLLDQIPLWGILPLAMFLCLLAVEIGYRLGTWRFHMAVGEKVEPVAAMVASVLGLLAFMLAFTFGLAANRFDERRRVVLEEANAIGTTYLRSSLLPEPQRTQAAELLRVYTTCRARYIEEHKVDAALKASAELHPQLWSQANAAAQQDPKSIMTGLFVQSLNETIDLHARRVFVGLRSRVPLILWLTLGCLTLLGMGSIGYQAGLSGTHRSPEMLALAVAFSSVLFLIVDLDRGHEGLLTVNQQAMTDLAKMMESGAFPRAEAPQR